MPIAYATMTKIRPVQGIYKHIYSNYYYFFPEKQFIIDMRLTAE